MTTKKKAPTRRSSTARRTSTPRSSTRRSSTRRAPRRRTSVASTVGAALGTVVVTALLNLGWPMRISLILLVVVLGVAWFLWTKRAEIAAAAQEPEGAQPPLTPAPGSPVAPQDAG